jgi:hypothetical protein
VAAYHEAKLSELVTHVAVAIDRFRGGDLDHFDVDRVLPEWEPNLEIQPPSWMVDGARVFHDTFGLGTVGRVGTYKDVPTVWVDFDDGQPRGSPWSSL